MLNFYDFEVFKYNWMVVIINPADRTETVIVDDVEKLKKYQAAHQNEIWTGYNNNHYDQYIYKGILCGFSPKEINDFIISDKKFGWQYSSLFRNIPMINYDVGTRIDGGLKSLEGFMGNNIKETSVPFDIDRPLTQEEIEEVKKYCTHDVEQTVQVFLERKADFEAQMGLIKMFNLPLRFVSKTKAQLSAAILEARKKQHDDEFNIDFPKTLRLSKYTQVLEWYKNPSNRDYSKSLTLMVAGVETQFGWGGIHSARSKYFGTGYFLNMDVASLYPSLMIKYKLHSRNIKDPQKFVDIYQTRLKYKAAKNPLQAPLKIVINSTYGCMKDKNNPLYDPLMANKVCIYGQLLLLDLVEKLESHCEIIQSNTDGILIRKPDGITIDDFYSKIDDIVYEWEKRTGLQMEFDEYIKVMQKDVNNYIVVAPDGHYKSKGAYVKKLGRLDFDLAIVNRAVVDYLTKNIPVDQTVNGCDDLIMFQKIVKVSGKYKCGWHNGKPQNERCFRVFASTRRTDGFIGKQKTDGATIEKFANTPEHCFIYNDDVHGVKCQEYLDKQWYIDLAKKRLNQFGVTI